MEAVSTIPVLREGALWLTEEEAFTVLMALVRGGAAGSPTEDALLAKTGELCRSFLSGKRRVAVEEAQEETWVLDLAPEEACLQAA